MADMVSVRPGERGGLLAAMAALVARVARLVGVGAGVGRLRMSQRLRHRPRRYHPKPLVLRLPLELGEAS